MLLVLVFSGLALTAYITATRWFGTVPLACSEGSDCDLVQSSRWSTLFGLPISFWGFLTYGVLFRLIWRIPRRRLSWRFAWVIAFVSVGISAYLTAISIFVIEATCIYCLTSFGLMLAILAILTFTRPDPLPGFQWRTWLPSTALAAVIVVAALQIREQVRKSPTSRRWPCTFRSLGQNSTVPTGARVARSRSACSKHLRTVYPMWNVPLTDEVVFATSPVLPGISSAIL